MFDAVHTPRLTSRLYLDPLAPLCPGRVIMGNGVWRHYPSNPREFSMAIDNPENWSSFGFLLALSVTASKSVAVLTDEKPLCRRPTRKLDRTAFVTDRRWR